MEQGMIGPPKGIFHLRWANWGPGRPTSTVPQVSNGQDGAAKLSAAPYLLPGEDVVLYAVALPNLPAGQRRAAATFAVEDLIAQPLDQVRVVMGPQFPEGSGKWLVAVVEAQTLSRASQAFGRNAPVLSETMVLPIPSDGWLVASVDGRFLVRAEDGSGFALDSSLFRPLWHAQNKPALTGYGDNLPDDLPFAARMPWHETSGLPLWSFDLAAITGRRPSYAKRPKWLWAAGLVTLALVAHLTLAALDVFALQRLAAQSRQGLAEAVAAYAAAGEDPVSAATRVLAAQGTAAAPAFLALINRAVTALPPPDSGVSLRGLRFDAATGRMVLAVIAPDITTLQAVEAALNAAGLVVVSGPASTRNGAAEAEMTLTAGEAT